jgi:hypothetical protein
LRIEECSREEKMNVVNSLQYRSEEKEGSEYCIDVKKILQRAKDSMSGKVSNQSRKYHELYQDFCMFLQREHSIPSQHFKTRR